MRAAVLTYSPEATFGIVISLFVAMPLVYWRMQITKRKRREDFIARFDPMKLRTNLINKSVVYRVIDQVDGRLRVQVVWSDAEPVQNGKDYMVKETGVSTFDQEAFLSGW